MKIKNWEKFNLIKEDYGEISFREKDKKMMLFMEEFQKQLKKFLKYSNVTDIEYDEKTKLHTVMYTGKIFFEGELDAEDFEPWVIKDIDDENKVATFELYQVKPSLDNFYYDNDVRDKLIDNAIKRNKADREAELQKKNKRWF